MSVPKRHRRFLRSALGGGGVLLGWVACEHLVAGQHSVNRAPVPVIQASLRSQPAADSRSAPVQSATASNPGATSQAPLTARPLPRDGLRVYAKTRHVWIRPEPDDQGEWIGFLWWGDSVAVRDPNPISGPGCALWYAVEPRGYICAEGRRATTNPDDPLVKELFAYAHNSSSPYPHPHYGEAVEAERYNVLPSEAEQRAREWDYTKQIARVQAAQSGAPLPELLQGVDLRPAPRNEISLPVLPSTLQLPHKRLIMHSSLAWTREVHENGRDWLLTDDLAWVPKDRVRPFDPITFHGVVLGTDARLPLALFRQKDQPSYRPAQGGGFEPDGRSFARLSWVELTGQTVEVGPDVFHETVNGSWVNAAEAVIPTPPELSPWGASLSQPAPQSYGPPPRQTWLEVNIRGGWLMAFENQRPAFVTLISPGRGGPPHRDRPSIETGSTPTGRFTINGKFTTATMVAPNHVVHSAVAWSQNFLGPYSIHTAYWHNAWGEPHSGGCVNVSPMDGRWLFEFTEPKLPEGWHGVRWQSREGAATVLLIRP